MSFQQTIFSMMARFSGQNNIVATPRLLCQATGSLEGGTFLSQLLYWSDKGHNGWFYKSYIEWYDEIYISEYQIRKLTKQFSNYGFLETNLRKANGSPTLHYRIKQAEFSEWILKFLRIDSENFQNGNPNISESITKTTTEITTEGREPDQFCLNEEIPPVLDTAILSKEEQPQPTVEPTVEPTTDHLQSLMDAAANRFAGRHTGRESQRLDGIRDKIAKMGIEPTQLTALVDAHLSEKGTKALADGTGDFADRELNTAQSFVLELCGIGKRFRDPEWVRRLWLDWRTNDKRPNPSEHQLLQHAAKMVSIPATTQPVMTKKQWMLQSFATDVAMLTGYTVDQLDEMYQAQIH